MHVQCAGGSGGRNTQIVDTLKPKHGLCRSFEVLHVGQAVVGESRLQLFLHLVLKDLLHMLYAFKLLL